MNDYLPRSDVLLKEFALNYYTYALSNLAALGLTTPQVTDLSTKLIAFDVSMQDHVAARSEALNKTAIKDEERSLLEDVLRELTRVIQANPAAPDGLKLAMGITVRQAPVRRAPSQPLDVIATPNANGVNRLEWSAGGNTTAATYLVHFRHSTSEAWQLAGTTRALRFDHVGQEPGQFTQYRVIAQVRESLGIPSFPVSVYGAGEGESFLQIAA